MDALTQTSKGGSEGDEARTGSTRKQRRDERRRTAAVDARRDEERDKKAAGAMVAVAADIAASPRRSRPWVHDEREHPEMDAVCDGGMGWNERVLLLVTFARVGHQRMRFKMGRARVRHRKWTADESEACISSGSRESHVAEK